MQITCDSCGKNFKLPPEKVPTQRFSFTCPKCGHRIKVDPVKTEVMKIEELRPPASQDADSVEITLGREEPATPPQPIAPPATAPQTAPSIPSGARPEAKNALGDETLPVSAKASPPAADPPADSPVAGLRPQDRRLLSGLAPVALIVHLDIEPSDRFDDDARRLGLTEIHHFKALEEAAAALQNAEAGLLLIRMARCPAPPCEPLAPLHALPFAVRRRTFVALEADNVKSLNGQVAFFLQVNCLINRQESERFSQFLVRAMLYHLRLYQHWDLETD